MKYVKNVIIVVFSLITICSSANDFQNQNETLLCDIQENIYSAFISSFSTRNTNELSRIYSLLENNNDNLSIYWKSYSLYYQSLYYLKMGDRKLSKKKVETAISILDELKAKDSEIYALIAYLQNYSMQFTNNEDIVNLMQQIKSNAQKSIDIDSKNLRAWYVLGNLDLHMPTSSGGGQKCEEYLLKALSLKEKYSDDCKLPYWGKSESYNALISYYIGVGKTKKAKSKLNEALKVFPDDYMLKKLEDKIKNE